MMVGDVGLAGVAIDSVEDMKVNNDSNNKQSILIIIFIDFV